PHRHPRALPSPPTRRSSDLLKPAASTAGNTVTLKSVWTESVLEADSRESALNGLRVFLGDPVRLHRDRLWLSRHDAEKTFLPLRSDEHTSALQSRANLVCRL